MYNKVELCGMNTAQLPVLTEAEKRELLARVRTGDAAARERMVEGNLRLVLSVVQRFASAAKIWTICFRWGASGSSRPSIILTPPSRCGSLPTACP